MTIACGPLLALAWSCSDAPAAGDAASTDANDVETAVDAARASDGHGAAGCLADDDCDPTDAACEAARCKAGACTTIALDLVACDDGDACTVGDRCVKGACESGADFCGCATDADCETKGDGDRCKGTYFCDKSTAQHRCELVPGSFVSCDASLSTPCATNVCEPSTGKCGLQPRPDGTLCDDGDPCTLDSACAGGTCALGTATLCACKQDADCPDDGDLCNGTLFCDVTTIPYTCKLNPASVVSCAIDADTACSKSVCQPADGTCAAVDVADGTPCDDGDAATVNEHCVAGQCQGGVDVAACAKDSDCTDDGDLCNGLLYCDVASATCKTNPATVVNCPSVGDSDCVKNVCVPTTGACVLSPVANNKGCEDGDDCTAGDFCLGGQCKSGGNTCVCKDDADCVDKEDGNACNGKTFCNVLTGQCVHNPATVVVCKTVDDTDCVKNACVPQSGACTPTAVEAVKAFGCEEGDPAGACRYEVKAASAPLAKNVPCDDADACTAGEVCAAGQCGGGTFVCGCESDADCDASEDGNVCNGTLFCNKAFSPAVCKLNPATVVTCPALLDKPCQANKCLPKVGLCQAVPANEGKGCDDGDACSIKDVCAAGQCAGLGELGCDDGDACTTDVCKPTVGCSHSAANCDDGNVCTVDACDSKTGQCDFGELATDGTLCDADGSGCTVNDSCAKGVCKAGAKVTCTVPTGPCDQATCVAQGATSFVCVKTPLGDGAACDDGVWCTLGASCSGGACKPSGKEALYHRAVAPGTGWTGMLRAAHPLADGGFAVVGSALPTDAGATKARMWMLRVDASGAPTWQDFVDLPGAAQGARGVGVVPVGGDKLAFVGHQLASGGTFGLRFVVRDLAGKPVHDATYPGAKGDEFAAEVAPFPGGGAVVVGRRVATGTNGGDGAKAGLVRRLSAYGQPAWQTLLEGSGDNDARGVDVASGGAVLVAGSDGSLVPGRQLAMLARLDASGAKVWLRGYGKLDAQAFEDAAWLNGGGAVAAGWRLESGLPRRYLVGVDAVGAEVWQQAEVDTFVAATVARRGGDQLVIAGRAQPAKGLNEAQVMAIDAFGNLAWSESPDIGGAGEAFGVVAVDGGGLLLLGTSGAGAEAKGWLRRSDAWGHASCAAAGKCATLSLDQCDDGNACTLEPCKPSSGCASAPTPGLSCASPDACGKQGVCNAGTCGPSDDGLLHNEVVDAGPLKEVIQVSPDGDGAFIAAKATDGKLVLLRVDRYGEPTATTPVAIAGAASIAGAVPIYDGGFATAYVDAAGSVIAARHGPGGDQLWKATICTPSTPSNPQGYSASQWAAWTPQCKLDAISATPGGARVVVSGTNFGSRAAQQYSINHSDVKSCLWARQIDLADGNVLPVLSGGHFCGGTQTYYAGYTSAQDKTWKIKATYGNQPLQGRTIALSDGGLLAFGRVDVRVPVSDNMVPTGFVHASWAAGFARLSAAHGEIWVREIASGLEDRIADVTQVDDGGYVGGGFRVDAGAQQDWLVALTAKGEVRWQRTGRIGAQARVRGVHVGHGGAVAVIADAVDAGFPRMIVGAIDGAGSVLDKRFVGPLGTPASAAIGQPSARLSDFSLLLAGAVAQAGKSQVLVAHVSPWGHDSCKAAGACATKAPADCDDGDPCVADLCDANKGCVGKKWPCDDGDPCTADSCEAAKGCVFTPLANAPGCPGP